MWACSWRQDAAGRGGAQGAECVMKAPGGPGALTQESSLGSQTVLRRLIAASPPSAPSRSQPAAGSGIGAETVGWDLRPKLEIVIGSCTKAPTAFSPSKFVAKARAVRVEVMSNVSPAPK